MKKLFVSAIIILGALGCKEKAKEVSTEESMAIGINKDVPEVEEWETLGIGEWQSFKGGPVPKFWHEEEGALVFTPPTPEERANPDGKGRKSFNIVTKKSYTSFVLSMEWKISEAGNSGIMWGVSEDEKYAQPYHTGLEIQVLDNEKHPDAKNGTKRQAGALYDLVPPSKDVTKPIGEWNTCVITIDYAKNQGSSVLNGVEVATFPVRGEELDTLLKGSKFDGWEGFGKYNTGKIALQDHNDVVAFRNIKIKEL